jgi:hypothetical protein
VTPELPLLLDDVIDPVAVVNEYRRLCDEYGYPEGVSFRVLLDHDYRQGAQLRELIPDQRDRARAADQHSLLKQARA